METVKQELENLKKEMEMLKAAVSHLTDGHSATGAKHRLPLPSGNRTPIRRSTGLWKRSTEP